MYMFVNVNCYNFPLILYALSTDTFTYFHSLNPVILYMPSMSNYFRKARYTKHGLSRGGPHYQKKK
uniref:Uncharacterized protein n=1 Tax=Octopus bimaculoides TaxID=37653 RepID=A0A0L8H149_OCTBM